MSVNKQTQGVRTVWWEEDAYSVAVCLLDQSLLPHEVLYLRLTTELEVADAIKTLKVRGAPAIGVTAAFGMALALCRLIRERGEALTFTQAQEHLQSVGVLLSRTRPTAVRVPASGWRFAIPPTSGTSCQRQSMIQRSAG